FHLNPEHPPLVKLWVGATMPGDFRLRPPKVLAEKSQEREWVEQTMFLDNDARAAQTRARIALWGFHGALLLALGALLWRACGLPLALALGVAAVAAAMLASGWRWRWAIACGVAMGLALAAKHSALAGLAGLGLLLVLAAQAGWKHGAREALRRHAMLAVAAGLALALLWSVYGMRFHAGADGSDAFNRPMADKIDELTLPHWRAGLQFADEHALLPRAYLWGLADTVRTGVEGRGIGMHFVWGKVHYGHPPWFSWPSILAAKLPLALLVLALAGLPLAFRRDLPAPARWTLAMVAAACGSHMLALVGSDGIWGGVRHAMPALVGAAV